MACKTDCRIDYDVNASLLDWQQQSDSLPLLTSDGADNKIRKPKPKTRNNTPTSDKRVSTKIKKQIAKMGLGADDSDQEQLITEASRDEMIAVTDISNESEKNDYENTENTRKEAAGLSGMYANTRRELDEAVFSTFRDEHTGYTESTYITAEHEASPRHDSKENVVAKLDWAETEVERSLQQAIDIINKKKSFLLNKLKTLRRVREKEEKEREKSKAKTPIQVLKSPRGSPAPNTDSENESESVFVRKKVIKTDKRKVELKHLAEIEVIVSKAEQISLAVRKITYMTPFLRAKVSADVDSDEETPDLVDVLAVAIDNTFIVMTTDFKNTCLKSFRHIPGEVVSSVLKFDNSPWGITRMDLDTVIVSIPLASKLCLVNITSGLVLKETIKTRKQYYGLVFIGSNLLVATSPYSSPRSVDTIDLNGTVLKTLVIDALLQQPSFICSTPTGSFVVSDLSKGTLLGVSNSLEVASGFERDGEARLLSSRGVSTNQDGDVFVVDYREKKVKVFSSQGCFLKDFLTSGDGLKYPYGVCFDNRGHIYVTDGGVIKIFTY